MSTEVAYSKPTDAKEIELNLVGSSYCGPVSEHMIEAHELEKKLDTNYSSGLTPQEAATRLERDGPNQLTPPPRTPHWQKFLGHLFGGFAVLLWVGSVLCFIVFAIDASVENLTLGVVLAAVVTLTGIFSFYQEFKSDQVLAGFLKLAATDCQVYRGGSLIRQDASNLVVGDVVKIEKGYKIPADVVILESTGVKVDNSSLTGESEPQKRTPNMTDEEPTRSRNVAFFSTNCTDGAGKGVVVRVGDETAIGTIAKDTTQGEKPDTLMKKEISNFVHIISYIACGIGGTFFIVAMVSGYNILDAAVFTIGIIVANVPEGLLATVTVGLTITAQRMHAKNVLVKNTETVETLGSINAIASDKTGTLTQNRMTVRHAIFNNKQVNKVPRGRADSSTNVLEAPATTERVRPAVGGGDVEDGIIDTDRRDSWQTGIHPVNHATGKVRNKNPELDLIVLCAGLCNHAEFEAGERSKPILNRVTTSDPSEGALLKFAHSHIDVFATRASKKEVACIPFSSHTKWMATVHLEETGHRVIIKGAPERVLERCTHHGEHELLTPEIRKEIEEANAEVAENGERVLAFAEMMLPDIAHGTTLIDDETDEQFFPTEGLRFVGMLSLEDPPRDEVPAAVGCCHDAGIRVIMVTGDHPLTARSIAGQVGILAPAEDGELAPLYNCDDPASTRRDPSKTSVVVAGGEIDKFDDDDWEYVLSRRDIVFARALPNQKQTIVAKLQERDQVVAVTGDGVNDAPALKKADVGIAMGSGSQVAQDAADMILMDDNFASIVKGIQEGRLVFANLKKSIAYTLTSNIPEITPFLCQIALKIPLALTTIMILCIDLGTDMLPAISFAYENAERDIMKVPPRDRSKDKLVTAQLISFSYLQVGFLQAIAAFVTFFTVFDRVGKFSAGSLLADRQGIIWIEGDGDDTDDGNCVFKNDDGDCVFHDERMDILEQAQTAFLASIVIMQVGCGIACKTRVNSILSQGMINNVLNFGIFQELALITLLVYAPFLQFAFGTADMDGIDWLIAIPFSVLVIFYDENRKFWFRKMGEETIWYQYFYF